MAVTLTEEWAIPIGQSKALCGGTIGMDSSYAGSGGEVIDAIGDLGYEKLWPAGASSGYLFSWDKTNQKVVAYRQKDPAAAGGADIAFVEVANAVDLSAVTFQYCAVRPA